MSIIPARLQYVAPVRAARHVVLDTAIRARLADYRPLGWSQQRWQALYREPDLHYLEGLEERGRYSVLVGYLDEVAAGASVLEVGCGSGLLAARARHVPFAGYVGTDVSVEALGAAADRCGGDDRIRFVPVGQEPDEPVDVVITNEVLYCVTHPIALLDSLWDRVRPGGFLLTSMFRHPGDHRLWAAIDDGYERLDSCDVRDLGHRIAPRGWRVALHRRPARAS